MIFAPFSSPPEAVRLRASQRSDGSSSSSTGFGSVLIEPPPPTEENDEGGATPPQESRTDRGSADEDYGSQSGESSGEEITRPGTDLSPRPPGQISQRRPIPSASRVPDPAQRLTSNNTPLPRQRYLVRTPYIDQNGDEDYTRMPPRRRLIPEDRASIHGTWRVANGTLGRGPIPLPILRQSTTETATADESNSRSQAYYRDPRTSITTAYHAPPPAPPTTLLSLVISHLAELRSDPDTIPCPQLRPFLPVRPAQQISLDALPQYRASSFLRPGSRFTGTQSATGGPNTITRNLPSHSPRADALDPTGYPISIAGEYILPHLRHTDRADNHRSDSFSFPPSPNPREGRSATVGRFSADSWPVSVTITTVDLLNATVTGVMSAVNVPLIPHNPAEPSPAPASERTISITTYFTGELIDFHTHSLLTDTYSTISLADRTGSGPRTIRPEVDASYWRKLQPFRRNATLYPAPPSMPNEQEPAGLSGIPPELYNCISISDTNYEEMLVRHMLHTNVKPADSADYDDEDDTTAWLASRCLGEWILMRWKERGFVSNAAGSTPGSSSTTGLTIGGYYYISMNRLDGRIEGLYFDERSSPFQYLTLAPGTSGHDHMHGSGNSTPEPKITALDHMGGGWPDCGFR